MTIRCIHHSSLSGCLLAAVRTLLFNVPNSSRRRKPSRWHKLIPHIFAILSNATSNCNSVCNAVQRAESYGHNYKKQNIPGIHDTDVELIKNHKLQPLLNTFALKVTSTISQAHALYWCVLQEEVQGRYRVVGCLRFQRCVCIAP